MIRNIVVFGYFVFVCAVSALGSHVGREKLAADKQALAEVQDEIDEIRSRAATEFTILGVPIEQTWAEAPSDRRSYCRIDDGPWWPARADGRCHAEDAVRDL